MSFKSLSLIIAVSLISQISMALNHGEEVNVGNDPCITQEIYAAKEAAAAVLNADDDDIELIQGNLPTRNSPFSRYSHRIPLRFENGSANAELVVRVDSTRSCEIIGQPRVRVISMSAP